MQIRSGVLLNASKFRELHRNPSNLARLSDHRQRHVEHIECTLRWVVLDLPCLLVELLLDAADAHVCVADRLHFEDGESGQHPIEDSEQLCQETDDFQGWKSRSKCRKSHKIGIKHGCIVKYVRYPFITSLETLSNKWR